MRVFDFIDRAEKLQDEEDSKTLVAPTDVVGSLFCVLCDFS